MISGPVVIVGSGISGLVCADEIQRLAGDDVELHVLEAADRPGGLIRSELTEGFRVEWGANGFLDNAPGTLELVERIGLNGALEPSSETASKRFIFHRGRLHLLPTSPLAFLGSSLLSLGGRLRVALEPFAGARPDGDESVHDFASRRIGREAASVLVDAMVAGVFAGDSRNMSLASAFPLLEQLEREHGGLIRGMVAKQRAARRARRAGSEAGPVGAGPGGRLTSFRDGMETLPLRLAETVGPRLHLQTAVNSLALGAGDRADGSAGFRLALAVQPAASPFDSSLEAATVILAIPAWTAAELLGDLEPALAGELAGIGGAPLAVVALGFDADELGGPPDGFGFLVPSSEGRRTLGCLWDSSIFRGRAEPGRVLLRTMIGGARHPEIVDLRDETLIREVRRDLGELMGLAAEPRFLRVIRHSHGISQYPPGHGARLARIDQHLAAFPGLFLTGSSYRGVAVNRLIEDAQAVARQVVARHGVQS